MKPLLLVNKTLLEKVKALGLHLFFFTHQTLPHIRSLSLSFFIILISCSSTQHERVPIFNDITFDLANGESVGDIGQDVKDVYTRYFNRDRIQIPLFKYIRHKDYEIFIGIPFNTTLEELIQRRGNDDGLASDPPIFYKTYTKDDQYLIEFAGRFNGNNLLYIAAISGSEPVARTFLNASALSDRIEPNEN